MNQELSNTKEKNKLNVNISGYEGPLDLLLELSKKQKVDITKVSILELAEQYLNFINKNMYNLKISADYLVMASFLAYLKSKMLLPDDKDDFSETSQEDLTKKLLQYDAIKKASFELINLPQQNLDFFSKKIKNDFIISNKIVINASLSDIINSYINVHQRNTELFYNVRKEEYYSIDDGFYWLKKIFKNIKNETWNNFLDFLPSTINNEKMKKSGIISLLFASLSLVKDGLIEITQKKNYDKIFIKSNKKNEF